MRSPVALLVVILLAASPVLAWHEAGHRATAVTAFAELRPAEQSRVIRILRAHPRFEEDFAAHMPGDIAAGDEFEQGSWLMQQASIWPDLVQQLEEEIRRQYNNSRWHYINFLVWLEPGDEAALAGQLDHNMDTEYTPPLRRSHNAVQALRGNLLVWRDADVSDTDKAVALCWILHLAGDLHQPLHTVALFSAPYFPTGDRGGNSVEVVWGDDTRNLHAVWDGLPTGMDDLAPTERTKQMIRDDVVNDAAIDRWVQTHAELARQFVYTDDVKRQLVARLAASEPPLITLSHEYLVAARALARRQVNLAGHRIARLLYD